MDLRSSNVIGLRPESLIGLSEPGVGIVGIRDANGLPKNAV